MKIKQGPYVSIGPLPSDTHSQNYSVDITPYQFYWLNASKAADVLRKWAMWDTTPASSVFQETDDDEIADKVGKVFPFLTDAVSPYWMKETCGCEDSPSNPSIDWNEFIVHLNDDHEWKHDQIADMLVKAEQDGIIDQRAV